MNTDVATERNDTHAPGAVQSTLTRPIAGTPERAPSTPARTAQRLGGELRALKVTLLTVGAVVLASLVAIAVALALYSPTRPLPVTAADFRLDFPSTLRAGTYRISFANQGGQAHELLVFRTSMPANALPLDHAGNVVEDSPALHNVLDSGDGLDPGKAQALTVKLTPGHYVVICNLPRHYRLGMHLDLTVTK